MNLRLEEVVGLVGDETLFMGSGASPPDGRGSASFTMRPPCTQGTPGRCRWDRSGHGAGDPADVRPSMPGVDAMLLLWKAQGKVHGGCILTGSGPAASLPFTVTS